MARRVALVWLAWAPVAWGGLVACAGESSPGAWVVRHDTIGDTVVVTTVSGALGPEARLVEESRIGAREGPEEDILGRVVALAVDRDDVVYLVDGQVPVLRRYAPDGHCLGPIGREGAGPGEYRSPDGGLLVLDDGRIALRDRGNTRIQWYRPDGEPLGEWPLATDFHTLRPMVRDSAGTLYTPVLTDFRTWDLGMMTYDSAGAPGDTIPQPAAPDEPPSLEARGPAGRGWTAEPVPFAPRHHVAFSPLGYWVSGLSSGYDVDLHRPEGVLRIRKAHEPVPVRPGERASEEERVRHIMRQVDPGWRWDGGPVPEVKPPYRDLLLSSEGDLWVLLHGPGAEDPAIADDPHRFTSGRRPAPAWREPVRFDVFHPDGGYAGRVSAPEGIDLETLPRPVIRGGRVWAVVRDADQVEYVVRFRIEPVEPAAGS